MLELKGSFIISIDYELMWGVRDKRTIENYGDAIKGVKKSTELTLELFKKYKVCATFATVGFLFHEDKQELLGSLPSLKPSYTDINLSSYIELEKLIGDNEMSDPYYFGYILTKKIIEDPLHEMATHTYCHYYCLEPGQTSKQFDADLKTAVIEAGCFDPYKTRVFF